MEEKKRGGGWAESASERKALRNVNLGQTGNQTRSAVKPNAVKNAYRVDEGKGKKRTGRKKLVRGALSERYEGKGREELQSSDAPAPERR